jgi:hypothetical protein
MPTACKEIILLLELHFSLRQLHAYWANKKAPELSLMERSHITKVTITDEGNFPYQN